MVEGLQQATISHKIFETNSKYHSMKFRLFPDIS